MGKYSLFMKINGKLCKIDGKDYFSFSEIKFDFDITSM